MVSGGGAQGFLIGHPECHARLQCFAVPSCNVTRQHRLISSGRNPKEIDDRNLVFERLAKPAVIGHIRVLAHEGVVDRFIAIEDLPMHLALVVVPDFTARLREDGLDRQQEPHLLRLEDATLRVNEGNALAPEYEAGLQLGRGQVIMDLVQPSHILESRHAHQGVAVVSGYRRHRSSLETMLVMPGQGIGIGVLADIFGCADPLTVKCVVGLAVIKFLPNAPADLEMEAGRYRHIACVEQTVNVPPQQEPVPWLVFATLAVRSNMRSLESRQSPLLCDRATPMVDICHQHAERALSKPWANKLGLAKSSTRLCDDRCV